MKRVLLLRHAKSDWDAAVALDIDRPLNARGRQDATAMGRYLAEEKITWDITLCSSALRAQGTVTALEQAMGRSLDSLSDDRLYMAPSESLVSILQRLDDNYDSVMLIGHNPGFHELALHLIRAGRERPFVTLRQKYPTGALVEISFEAKTWKKLTAESGILRRFIRPKDLK